jgi:hypothetical protein
VDFCPLHDSVDKYLLSVRNDAFGVVCFLKLSIRPESSQWKKLSLWWSIYFSEILQNNEEVWREFLRFSYEKKVSIEIRLLLLFFLHKEKVYSAHWVCILWVQFRYFDYSTNFTVYYIWIWSGWRQKIFFSLGICYYSSRIAMYKKELMKYYFNEDIK